MCTNEQIGVENNMDTIRTSDIISVRRANGGHIFGQVIAIRKDQHKMRVDHRLWHYEIYPLVPLLLPQPACTIRVHKDNVSNEFTDEEQGELTMFKLSEGL